MARLALDRLIAAGFRPAQLSLLDRDGQPVDPARRDETVPDITPATLVGSGAGAAALMLVGLATFALVALASSLAFGARSGALAATAGGAAVGELVGLLLGMAVFGGTGPRLADLDSAGNYVVAVRCAPEEEERAAVLLALAGAAPPVHATLAPAA
jgi:hypothetical protein